MNIATVSNTGIAAERLGQIPAEFWLKLGLCVAAILVTVFLLRKLAQANKVLVSVVAALVFSVVGFSWIYERDEPTWATPAVQFLAGFFPTKGRVTAMH